MNNKIELIRDYFANNNYRYAVIEIDNSLKSIALLKSCIYALGKDNIIGIVMSNNRLDTIDKNIEICRYFDIKYVYIDISNTYNAAISNIKKSTNLNTTDKCNAVMSTAIKNAMLDGVASIVGGVPITLTNNYNSELNEILNITDEINTDEINNIISNNIDISDIHYPNKIIYNIDDINGIATVDIDGCKKYFTTALDAFLSTCTSINLILTSEEINDFNDGLYTAPDILEPYCNENNIEIEFNIR